LWKVIYIMSYYNLYGRAGNPWLSENRLNGLYNEYAELNDVAIRNNNIYINNVIETNRKCWNGCSSYIPSIYSAPYYASPYYASPYYSPYYGGYYGFYGRPYL
jgi:hypothetical protein